MSQTNPLAQADPAEWSEKIDPSGNKYYVHNNGDRRSSWTPHAAGGGGEQNLATGSAIAVATPILATAEPNVGQVQVMQIQQLAPAQGTLVPMTIGVLETPGEVILKKYTQVVAWPFSLFDFAQDVTVTAKTNQRFVQAQKSRCPCLPNHVLFGIDRETYMPENFSYLETRKSLFSCWKFFMMLLAWVVFIGVCVAGPSALRGSQVPVGAPMCNGENFRLYGQELGKHVETACPSCSPDWRPDCSLCHHNFLQTNPCAAVGMNLGSVAGKQFCAKGDRITKENGDSLNFCAPASCSAEDLSDCKITDSCTGDEDAESVTVTDGFCDGSSSGSGSGGGSQTMILVSLIIASLLAAIKATVEFGLNYCQPLEITIYTKVQASWLWKFRTKKVTFKGDPSVTTFNPGAGDDVGAVILECDATEIERGRWSVSNTSDTCWGKCCKCIPPLRTCCNSLCLSSQGTSTIISTSQRIVWQEGRFLHCCFRRICQYKEKTTQFVPSEVQHVRLKQRPVNFFVFYLSVALLVGGLIGLISGLAAVQCILMWLGAVILLVFVSGLCCGGARDVLYFKLQTNVNSLDLDPRIGPIQLPHMTGDSALQSLLVTLAAARTATATQFSGRV